MTNTKQKNYFSFACCLLLLFITLNLWAQAPTGYYSSTKGKKERAIKTALFNIITSHTALSYDALWTAFQQTDKRPDGSVWDMYSTVKFRFGQNQCGNYSEVGDCYNREHSFPKSWFNDAKPMYTDLFHLYPTDGKVNGQRSNFPYGETANGTTLPDGALGKLGTCTFPGYSGKVFEPVDEYKGDFARSYFYMATCYEDKISSWNCDMLSRNSYPCYTTWAVDLLLKWCRQDPVSQKEIDRNNAVYAYQKNRNPYIDYPQLVEYVWGTRTNEAFDPDNSGSSLFTEEIVFSIYNCSNGFEIETDTALPLSIFDIVGRCVHTIQVVPGKTIVNLPAGFYLVNGTKVVVE